MIGFIKNEDTKKELIELLDSNRKIDKEKDNLKSSKRIDKFGYHKTKTTEEIINDNTLEDKLEEMEKEIFNDSKSYEDIYDEKELKRMSTLNKNFLEEDKIKSMLLSKIKKIYLNKGTLRRNVDQEEINKFIDWFDINLQSGQTATMAVEKYIRDIICSENSQNDSTDISEFGYEN